MNEHYCPFCRRELMAENHAPDCKPGQMMVAQMDVIGLRLRPVGAALHAESRRSWWGRMVWRGVGWIYGEPPR